MNTESVSSKGIRGRLLELADELVSPDRSCTCGERRMDWLVWTDDAINVTCATCGEIFRPGGAR